MSERIIGFSATVGSNIDRLRSVDRDAWNDLTPDQRWAANTNFLDQIVSKGDTVNLSLPKSQIDPNSYLAKEIDYLTRQKGYKWVNQWSLRPPSRN